MGELQLTVNPSLCLFWKSLRREFPSTDHELFVFAVNGVPVNIHVQEVVVQANELDLVQCVQKRTMVPEPKIVDDLRIGLNDVICDSRGLTDWIGRLLDTVQPKGLPSSINVPTDKLTFLFQF